MQLQKGCCLWEQLLVALERSLGILVQQGLKQEHVECLLLFVTKVSLRLQIPYNTGLKKNAVFCSPFDSLVFPPGPEEQVAQYHWMSSKCSKDGIKTQKPVKSWF